MTVAGKVLYVQYAAPGVYPPIERSARIFKQHGWQVRFLGVRAQGQSAALTSGMHPEEEMEFLLHSSGGARAMLSYLRFWWRAWRRVQREKPDVVYLSDVFSYPVGWLITRTSRAITVQHEHDTPLAPTALHRLIAPLRRAFMRRADIRVNPQADRLQTIAEETGCGDIQLVYNCPSVTELPADQVYEQAPGKLVLWHHGSLSPGRMPPGIIDALALLPSGVEFHFAGYETVNTKGFIASVLDRAKDLGVADRVTFHGALPRDQLYAASSQTHVGVALFVTNFIEPMAGASNKPFDFLGCTMALLVNDTAEWTDFLAGQGVASFCNPEDPKDIARAIQALYDDPDRLAAMAAKGRALIEMDWNYEAQFQPVLDQITALMAQRKA